MDDTILSIRERLFKYIFHGLCGFATLGFTIFCVHQYTLDEDVAKIEFQEFNSDEDHIYPTVTMCFPNPLLEDKLRRYGDGINVSTYTSFLVGDLWDERMAQIDYDDVSVDIDHHLLGKHLSCDLIECICGLQFCKPYQAFIFNARTVLYFRF